MWKQSYECEWLWFRQKKHININFRSQLPMQQSGAKKEPQSQKIERTAPKNFLNNSRAPPHKTRVLRQISPESSPESSAKSLSQKFFGVPFLSLEQIGLVFRTNPGLLRALHSRSLSCPWDKARSKRRNKDHVLRVDLLAFIKFPVAPCFRRERGT